MRSIALLPLVLIACQLEDFPPATPIIPHCDEGELWTGVQDNSHDDSPGPSFDGGAMTSPPQLTLGPPGAFTGYAPYWGDGRMIIALRWDGALVAGQEVRGSGTRRTFNYYYDWESEDDDVTISLDPDGRTLKFLIGGRGGCASLSTAAARR